MSKMQDPNYLLTDQYKDDTNLNARIRIHELFSTNKQGFHRWAFDHLKLPANSKILELGCGPGQLWLKNLDRVPQGWDVTLTDFSPGMIEAAQRNLGDRFHFQVVDAQQIPFEDETFDCVIANYMLYHVPDRPRALSEIRRVLKPSGRFYAATLGRNHLKEIGELVHDFDPNLPALGGQTVEPFTLENGQEQIKAFFSNVSLFLFQDSLEITESEPLVSYILSGLPQGKLSGTSLSALRNHAQKALTAHNPFHVTKVSGLFEAMKRISTVFDDFVGYIGDPDIHDGHIRAIEPSGSKLSVTIEAHKGRRFVVEFNDVLWVKSHCPEDMMLYALAEWKGEGNVRRFVFANWDEGDDAFLEVDAKDFQVIG